MHKENIFHFKKNKLLIHAITMRAATQNITLLILTHGKLRNEELSDLYSLANFVRLVKSRRMRWAGHVVRMGGGERVAQGSGGET